MRNFQSQFIGSRSRGAAVLNAVLSVTAFYYFVLPVHDSWILEDYTYLFTVSAMLTAALGSDHHAREDSIRVARIVRHLHADALGTLGEREAEDVAGAALRLVRDRVMDIFGPAAWDEALREP